MTGTLPEQSHKMFGGYRIYFTAEAWVITYQDHDFIRINRIPQHTEGFIYTCAELIFMAVWGKRTAIRERFAVFGEQIEVDAHELDMKLKANHQPVMEIRFVPDARGRYIPENCIVPESAYMKEDDK